MESGHSAQRRNKIIHYKGAVSNPHTSLLLPLHRSTLVNHQAGNWQPNKDLEVEIAMTNEPETDRLMQLESFDQDKSQSSSLFAAKLRSKPNDSTFKP